MSKTSKRVLSWVMTVLMVVSMLSSFAIPAAFAADAKATGPDVANAYYVSHTFTSGNVSFTWEGKTVNGTVGTNAFNSIDAAIQAAKAKGNTCPDIIVPSWNSANLVVTGGCRIYAPNWNTCPYLRDAQDGEWKAVNSNGANWTENPDYFDSQVIINNLIIEGTASGTVEVYGFTQIDGLFAGGNGTKRTASSPKIDILVKNGVGKCNVTTKNGGSFFKGYNNNSRNQDDSLTLENFYFKWIRTGGDSRLFGDQNMPAHVTLDGVWMDYDTCGFIRHDFTKTSGKNSSITIKNSNIRNTGKNHTGTNSNGSAYNRWNYICFGAFLSNPVLGTDGTLTNDITFENNVFYNANNTDSATNLALFHLDETGVGSLTIKDNYAINTSGKLAKVLNKRMGSANNVIGDGDVKIEGNKFLGYYDSFTQPDDKKEAIDNNFVVSQPLTSVDAYKTAVGNELKADTGLADGSTGAYYLDYNMKHISSDFALDIKIGEDDQITVDGNEIIANVKQGGASVTPSIKAKGADVAVKISTKSDFSDTVTTFDTSVKESVATYYVRAYSKTDANVYMDYVLTVAVEKSKEVIEFESENAYIINKDWSDEQLAGDADLTIWFNGKDRTVNPKTDKLFNSFDKAHDAAFATLTAENYFTLNPIFVFGPGDYSGSIIHIPANATIYGSNAGISPNAKNPADATIDSIKADSGIAANPDFNLDKATKLGAVYFTTRTDDGTGKKWNVVDVNTEAGVKWQGARDAALKANPTAELTLVIDGILQGGQFSMSGFDTGNKYTYKGTANISPVQGRVNEIIIKNSKFAANTPIGAWNSTWHYQNFVFDSVRVDTNIDNWGTRFIDIVTFKNSYFTKQTSSGALFKVWTGESSGNPPTMRHDTGTLNIEESVLYDNSGAYFTLNMDSLHDNKKVINFNLTDSVLYNAGTANWGYFAFYNREDFNRTLNVTVTGNEIYHDKNSNTLFNGNKDYLTKGKNNFIFTENKVIGTLSNVAPNAEYSDADMKLLFGHNFNNNFVATAKDAVAKVPGYADNGFPKAPNSGYTSNPDWNYNDPIYYLDFDFKYKNTDAAVTALNAGSGNLVDLQPRIITANILSKTGVIDASSFTVGANNIVTIMDGSTAVSSIDLTKVSGVKDYTVLVGIKGEAANIARTYTLRVIDGAVDFNAALKNGGITYGDKTFTAANTVAFAPSGQATYTDKNGSKYFYQYFNGTLYKYTIDNENVFAWATKNITLNSINRRSEEGAQNADGTWNWVRSGLDLDKVKDKAENGNIILAGENFTASSAQLIIPYATSIYGLNAGVNPVNKASATAANDYKASLTAEWGQHGQTKIGTVRIGNAKDGDIVIDGITLTERVYDTVRYEMYNSKDEALNVTFENIVIDTPAAAGSIFNINNALTTNGSGAGGGDGAGSLPITEAGKEFGKIYNDSFTLENCYIKSSATNHVFDEQIPANVTVRNYYEDCSTSGRVRNLFGFMKTGAYNMISNITIEDSIIRGNATQLTNRIFHSEGPRNPVSGFDYGVNITIRNNVFFKSAGTGYIRVVPAHVDNLAIVNNIFVADTTMNVYENQGGAKDIANVTISDNRYVGFADANISHTAMEANLTEVNGFATTDANAYKNANGYTGYQAAAFGTNDYYVNFGMTAKASEFAITKFEAGTSDIKDITVDADNRKIQFSLARGTTDGISVVLAGDNAKWFFSTDADGKNKINVISREDLRQLVSTYYFNIESNGVVLTYEMEILNDIVPDFAEVEGLDPAYFSNDAVIVTDKAANLAVGTEIFEQWDGQWYRFYAGINAFTTVQAAWATSAVPDILVLKATKDNGMLNGDLDLRIEHSMRLFTPNYKTNPVISDGYGQASPTQGGAWGYNTAYDAHKDDVRIKSISTGTPAGETVIELYGLTIDSQVNDNSRQVGSTVKFRLENTLFTTTKGSGYLFSCQGPDYVQSSQKNEWYIKNAYYGSETSGTNFRLMGEKIPAHITFDNVYIDFDEAGLTNTSYIKHTGKDSSIVFKNSYINANVVKDANGHLQFEGYIIDENGDGTIDKTQSVIPEGWSSELVFDNNIIHGILGYVTGTNHSTVAMFRYRGQSFNNFELTNNYFNFPTSYTRIVGTDMSTAAATAVAASQLFYSFGDKTDMTTLEGTYTITGNVFNGLTNRNLVYANGADATYFSNMNHVIYDNFISRTVGGNAYDENNIGVAPNTPGVNTDNVGYYRLTADGTKLSNVIQDMTWSDRVTFSGTTAIANIYDCDNIYTVTENANADDPTVIDSYTYKFDLSSLLKNNKYNNIVKVAFGDGEAVDLETGKLEITRDSKIAPDTAIRVTVTVDSPDGRADEQTYTFVIFMNGGDAPAFKGNFKDDANIISDNAVIVTPAAAGATGTINAQWLGETYSFTVGTNAFATVEDALAAAKAANNKDMQIIVTGTTASTNLTIDWPAKLYGVNYNVSPYVADGYGTSSPSNGKNWYENTEYTDEQTLINNVQITAEFAGGTFEMNGFTFKGRYLDDKRAVGNVADLVFKNTLLDLNTNQRYTWSFNAAANRNTAGNKLTMTNTYVKSLGTAASWFFGEHVPETTTFDGMWIPDGNAVHQHASNAPVYVKVGADNAALNPVITYKNFNFRNCSENVWTLDGTDGKSKATHVFDNGIFSNFSAYTNGTNRYLMNVTAWRVGGVTLTNNYFEAGEDWALADIAYWGTFRIDANTIRPRSDNDIDYIVENNVFNGFAASSLTCTPTGVYAEDNSVTVSIKGNYRLAAYVPNPKSIDTIGQSILANQGHIDRGHTKVADNYFALDYDRTLMSNEVGDVEIVDGKNILIDTENKTVTYAYNELVTKNASDAITVDLTAFTTLTNKYNSVVAVLSDGTEKDLSTIFTYDGATLGETLTLKVYSYDKSASKTTYTVTFVEGAHAMGEWVPYTEAGCGTNATEIQRCNVDECTIDEGTCGHYVTREVEGSALPHQLPESGNYNDDATCLADGTQTVYCKDCGEAVVISAPGTKRTYHSYTNYVANNDGTCMVDGTMTAVCDWCGENASTVLNPEDTKEINKDNHLYGEYIYNNDATCLADGTQTRYCIHEDAQGAVCGHADETVTAEGTMIEHDWSQYVYNNDETCQNNGTETATCPGVAEANGVAPECGAQDTREVEGTKLDHHVFEEDAYVLTTEATCTTPGYETAPCKYAYDGCTETHTRLNPEKYPINPDNHDYAKPVYQEDATCVTDGTQTRKCKRDGCGYVLTETAPGTAGQGTHIWGEYVANNDADCVHDGTMTASCIADPNCTAKDTVINPNDPAGKKAHTWGEYVYNNDATCVKDGTKTATCTVDGCGATDTEKDTDHLKSTVPHTYTEWKSNNDATCTADGTKTRECTADRCYHTETVKDEGTMKPHAWGEYKYNNDATYLADGTKTAKCTTCTATNTITAAGTKTPLKTIVNTASKFVDVKAGAWYKNAVDYAVTYGLISGTTATTFEPNGTITRGMFVTILARAAGVDTSAAANKAAKTQFNDVAAGKYYAAAIAWASSKQIVAGMTNTEFAPDAPIARQQLAVMLYRFASSQGVTLKAKKTVSFADAATVSTWAKDGVAACAAAGIVNGYTENGKTYFKPYKTATRAEATQMMYMFHAEYITGTIK